MTKRTDLTGGRYGRLVATERLAEKLYNEEAYRCTCDCGNETNATRSQLTGGRKKSCGCLRKESPANMPDLTGQRFGMLKVIDRAGKTKNGNALWRCMCDCGRETNANATTLRRGEIVSCGCQKGEQISNARSILMDDMTVDGIQVPLLTKKVRSDSHTGHKGIHRRIRKGQEYYEVSITVKGKRIYCGQYKDLSSAIAARKAAEEHYFKPILEKYVEGKTDGKPMDR